MQMDMAIAGLRFGDSPVMWSSHTDTVHATPGQQRITYKDGLIKLSALEAESNCLGGDCGVGVWLMLEMIRAKKPGLYIFHRDEETGGHGSEWLARNNAELLDGIQIAIALDRRGTDSVITYQAGARCASDAFAESLARQIPGYKPDSTGLFTDTANYTAIVPECTNLSVGYEGAHSKAETVDIAHACALLDCLLALDVSALAVERDPTVSDDRDDWGAYDGRYGSWERERPYGRFDRRGAGYDCRDVRDFVDAYPDIVADYLEQLGITLDDLYAASPWVS